MCSERAQPLRDRREVLGGHAAVVGTADDLRLDLLLDRGDANHEELVEIRSVDRDELQALEQRVARVERLFEHPVVELEPRELAADVERGVVERRPAERVRGRTRSVRSCVGVNGFRRPRGKTLATMWADLAAHAGQHVGLALCALALALLGRRCRWESPPRPSRRFATRPWRFGRDRPHHAEPGRADAAPAAPGRRGGTGDRRAGAARDPADRHRRRSRHSRRSAGGARRRRRHGDDADRDVLRGSIVPLALPVSFAGLRTAAIETIASATLATFIGAGGLGDEIVRGLQTDDATVLLGGRPRRRGPGARRRVALGPRRTPDRGGGVNLVARTRARRGSARGSLLARVRRAQRRRARRLEELHRIVRHRRDLRAGARTRRSARRAALQPRVDPDRDGRDATRRHRSLSRVHRDRADRRAAPGADAAIRARSMRRSRASSQRRYELSWLKPSPMNDSQALATTRAIARREADSHALRSRAERLAPAAWRRSRSSSAAPTGCPACSAFTAAIQVSPTCARTTSR